MTNPQAFLLGAAVLFVVRRLVSEVLFRVAVWRFKHATIEGRERRDALESAPLYRTVMVRRDSLYDTCVLGPIESAYCEGMLEGLLLAEEGLDRASVEARLGNAQRTCAQVSSADLFSAARAAGRADAYEVVLGGGLAGDEVKEMIGHLRRRKWAQK